MKARPILFSAPMVRALLDDRKTQTRRIVKGAPTFDADYTARWFPNAIPPRLRLPDEWSWWSGPPHGQSCDFQAACPYGAPGDLLWVRERWQTEARWDRHAPSELRHDVPIYPAVEPEVGCAGRSRAAMHMPRWASRLTLEITDVRVERLQAISRADAIAEGLQRLPASGRWVVEKGQQYAGLADHDPRQVYSWLWEAINGPDSWTANPWVWALTFEVHRANVDAVLAERGRG